jgi:hypothetical protein
MIEIPQPYSNCLIVFPLEKRSSEVEEEQENRLVINQTTRDQPEQPHLLTYSLLIIYSKHMAPRRKDLTQQSIWDETLLAPVLTQIKLRLKLWRHLINSFAITPTNYHNKYKSLDELPYDEWNFPKIPVEKIKAEFKLFTTTISERNESARGDTTKLLVRLQDGHEVETVIMRHKGHATVCISSQIGCQMGCRYSFSISNSLFSYLKLDFVLLEPWVSSVIYLLEKLLSN